MKTKDVTKILKDLGWKTKTGEIGDKYALFHLPDRVVKISYKIYHFTCDELRVTPLVSTDSFCKIAAKIGNRKEDFIQIICFLEGFSLRKTIITDKHVIKLSEQSIKWAKKQNLVKGIDEYAKLPTDSVGIYPRMHLAALALQGNVSKLKSYQASFDQGDRLGFVPYITKEYIDIAVSIAEEYANKS